MLSTEYTPGTPRWIDLGSPDVKATDAFYTSVFGWEKEDAGPDAGTPPSSAGRRRTPGPTPAATASTRAVASASAASAR
jgi:predicted enzyme related to lactoylglutathione lyase